MKKQIFTLLALLLTVCSGAWAADNISCSASLSATAGTPTVSNCVLAFYGDEGSLSTVPAGTARGDYFYAKMNNDKNYYQLTLAQGDYTKFIAGDVIKVYLYTNGSTVGYLVGKTTKTKVEKKNQTKDKVFGYEHTLTADEIESDGTVRIYRNSSNTYFAKITVTGTRSTSSFTVTFDAGSNGTCATTSLTEESAGAGVTLPAVTPNTGYVFNGWYTAASEGTKVGVAGETYSPTANTTLYAQYSAEAAPTINIANTTPSTQRGKAVTLTATAIGAPTPTVTWYQSETATTSGGSEKGTGLTYNPDVATEGTFYYYAVASNGVGSDATSELVTLTVTSPDINRTGFNTYYLAKGDVVIGGAKVLCDDITMEYDDVTYNSVSDDNMINSLNSNYVASVSTGTNGWGVTFTPKTDGFLAVGVVINKDKAFSITNVTSFDYANSASESGTESSPWTPTAKQYAIVTINAMAGTSYKFSVAGSKMSFYGFEFNPPITITPTKEYTTYVTSKALDFTGLELKAYVATTVATTASESKVMMESVTTVPAGTPLVLKKGDAASYDVPVIASANEPESNLLKAGDGTTNVGGDGVYDYILSNGKFYHASPAGPVAVGKAYLHLESDPTAGARELSLSFEDGSVTAISNVNRETITNNGYFNLAGQRVAQPTKGLYIVNGKKVVVK